MGSSSSRGRKRVLTSYTYHNVARPQNKNEPKFVNILYYL